jgi:oxygen-independent coproporphyrinogen-3 oxidase
VSLSAYIHIPFCKRKCYYCAFYSYQAFPDTINAFVSALENQIRRSPYAGSQLRSVFFGGGTPSVLPLECYLRLLDALNDVFDLSNAEVTTELNPESVRNLLNSELIGRFTRFSIGVQSFDDEELSLLGRLHNSSQAKDAYFALRDAGAKNINIDLMIALPGPEHLKKLENTLETAISLDPDHISAYILTPEEGTPLYKKYGDFNEDSSSEPYIMVCEKLKQAGYEHYEISNFAKKDRRCVHNMCYWTQQQYFAFGPSACGFDGIHRYRINCSAKDYISKNGIITPSVEETLDTDQLFSEKVMLSLRLSDGTDAETLAKICENETKQRFVDQLISSFLARINESGGLSLTDRGFLVSNSIISELM